MYVFFTKNARWCQEFSDGRLTLPKKGLECNWLGTVTAKNLREKRSAPSDEDHSPFSPFLVLHRWISTLFCFIVGGGISRGWIFF